MLHSLSLRNATPSSSKVLASIGSLRISRSLTTESHLATERISPLLSRIKSKLSRRDDNRATTAPEFPDTSASATDMKLARVSNKKHPPVNTTALLISVKNKDIMIKKLKLRQENVTSELRVKTSKLEEVMAEIQSMESTHWQELRDRNETIVGLNRHIADLQSSLSTMEELLEKRSSENR